MIQFKTKSVCVFESALFRTTSTVIQSSETVLVVDPTWLPEEVNVIRYYVESILGNRKLLLLFTHSDYDHIIAYRAFPGAEIIASAAFAANPDKELQLDQIRKFDNEYYIQRDYPIEYPEVDHLIEKEEQFLTVGDIRFTFWPAPGHNPDGIFTLVEPLGIWLAGDYLSNIEFPFVYHSFIDYRRTLTRAENIIRKKKPALLVSGHGDVAASWPEMNQRCVESYWYLDLLTDCVEQDKPFPLDELANRYRFAAGMQDFHQENEVLYRKEFSKLDRRSLPER